MTDLVHKDNVVSLKIQQREKQQVNVCAVNFVAIEGIFDFFDYSFDKISAEKSYHIQLLYFTDFEIKFIVSLC